MLKRTIAMLIVLVGMLSMVGCSEELTSTVDNVVNEAVNVYEENKDKLQSGNKTTTDVIENGGDFEDINRSEQVELFLIEGINTLTEGLDYTEDYEANYIMKHSRNAYIAIKSQNACDAIVAALDEVNPLDITYQEVDAFVYPFMEEEIRNNFQRNHDKTQAMFNGLQYDIAGLINNQQLTDEECMTVLENYQINNIGNYTLKYIGMNDYVGEALVVSTDGNTLYGIVSVNTLNSEVNVLLRNMYK